MAGGKNKLTNLISSIIPPLTTGAHKGQAGRIGIIGGSLEYTGAPFYSAISSLRIGADLAHVFCMKDAAIPIKSYSPELIVHPILDMSDPMSEFEEWLPRFHALVVGPGLGRKPQTFSTLAHILEAAKIKEILLVVDADALFFLNENYDIIQGYTNAILTPNRVELARLYRSVMKEELRAENVLPVHVQKLAKQLSVTILCKGEIDLITDGANVYTCDSLGSPRRCGGQGDILAGAAAVLFYWAYGAYLSVQKDSVAIPPAVLAAWGACAVTRTSSNMAFCDHGRGTLTTDILTYVSRAFSSLFLSTPNSF